MTDFKAGDKIRHKKVIDGVRVGSAEAKVIDYISDTWVVYTVAWATGDYVGKRQRVAELGEFSEVFELIPTTFTKGVTYRHRTMWGADLYECIYSDDEIAFFRIVDRDGVVYHNHLPHNNLTYYNVVEPK